MTFPEFREKILEERTWRRKEIKHLADLIILNKGDIKSAAIRSGIALLYAHVEGFVKMCADHYLNYVSKQRLPHYRLKSQFVALALSQRLGLLEVKSIEERTRVVNFFINEFGNRANVPTKNIINTRSNLSYSVLEEILFTLDINSEPFKKYKSNLDYLVGLRNHIAHGNYEKVTEQSFIELRDEVDNFMNHFYNEIDNAAVEKKYIENRHIA